jgi:hypothetical protein
VLVRLVSRGVAKLSAFNRFKCGSGSVVWALALLATIAYQTAIAMPKQANLDLVLK